MPILAAVLSDCCNRMILIKFESNASNVEATFSDTVCKNALSSILYAIPTSTALLMLSRTFC